MLTRRIADLQVSAIGLGAMPLTMDERPSAEQAVSTVHAALDAGVTLIDTADAYGPSGTGLGANEELVAAALASYSGPTDHVVIATKGGHTRQADGSWGLNGRPEYLRQACEGSLRRLGVEAIDLYQHHRPDPDVPYEESMGGLRALYDAGLVRWVGLSNADEAQIRLAKEIVGDGLAAVQNQFSPRFRSSEPEIDVCAELGLAFLPWSPLGGVGRSSALAESDGPFARIGRAHELSPQQVCLAWELQLSPVVIPIPGASRPASITSSAAAVHARLNADEMAVLSSLSVLS